MSKPIRVFISLIVAAAITALALTVLIGPTSHAAGIVVDSTADNTTAGDGYCTLREAINNSNSDGDTTSGDCAAGTGADTITFSPTLFSGGGVITITQGRLVIQGNNSTTINGDVNADGNPDVEIRYSSGTANDGLLVIQSSNNLIKGLSITNSPAQGIYIDGNGSQSDNNQIVNNWIGLDLAAADRGNTKNGIYIWHVAGSGSSATDNTIQENTISGNGRDGIYIKDAPGTNILSNTIGLNPARNTTRNNTDDGITLAGAMTTTIQCNYISGNSGDGLYITGTQLITIANNVIGLNVSGTGAPNYGTAGINVAANAVTTTIHGNTVSGNRNNGIYLGPGTTGAVIAGNYIGTNSSGSSGLGNGRLTNKDGIQLGDAYSNTIGGPTMADRNIIAHNGRAGVFIAGEQADYNTVQNNYIGTDVNGSADLGNGYLGSTSDSGDGGIYIYNGADYNTIRDNLIRFNYIGVRFSGGSAAQVAPPQHNQVFSNTITSNDKYGVVNQTTHRNTTYTTPSTGDNLLQNNVITGTGQGCIYSWCSGIGIFNYGASPRIVTNTVSHNDSFGIVNRVYFGADGPANAADDLLSMPYIAGNTISSNGDDGIQSRDTTPLNKATLLEDNTFVNNSGEPHISQRWFVAVEVVSGTQTINSGLAVTITKQGGGNACPGGACLGNDFDSDGGSGGIWGPSGVVYTDVENLDDGTTTWFEVIEYQVTWQGTWVSYTSHLVQAGGAYQGGKYYDFDGITTTHEISGDVNLPFCIPTGITGTDNSLCRYQIAQIDVFGSFGNGDWDGDGIPDDEEGGGDTDGDGTPDYQDTDSDGDGIPDDEEYDWCVAGGGSAPCDSDGDGTPDYQDDDSDNDGIPDDEEYDWCVAGGGSAPCDTDGDGTPDYADSDSDNDGIPDDEEYDWCGSAPCDSDGDGTPDYVDDDDDGDGILTADEDVNGDGDPTNDDSDGDGTPDYLDTDSDGDGTSDMDEAGCTDSDLDGQADTCPSSPPDTDSDGIPDYLENNTNDADGDGNPDYQDTDSDGDGIPDDQEWDGCGHDACDSDGDGIPDYLESNTQDTDNDGTPDYLDTDSDGDDIADGDEGAYTDTDGDGVPDYLENNLAPDNSAPPSYDTDPDNDSNAPNNDTDSDNDGILDGTEFYPQCAVGADQRDSDNDGIPNCADRDADGDGIPNFLDLDSDNDGKLDRDEGAGDSNGNGIPDYLDPPYSLYLPLVMRNSS